MAKPISEAALVVDNELRPHPMGICEQTKRGGAATDGGLQSVRWVDDLPDPNRDRTVFCSEIAVPAAISVSGPNSSVPVLIWTIAGTRRSFGQGGSLFITCR